MKSHLAEENPSCSICRPIRKRSHWPIRSVDSQFWNILEKIQWHRQIYRQNRSDSMTQIVMSRPRDVETTWWRLWAMCKIDYLFLWPLLTIKFCKIADFHFKLQYYLVFIETYIKWLFTTISSFQRWFLNRQRFKVLILLRRTIELQMLINNYFMG